MISLLVYDKLNRNKLVEKNLDLIKQHFDPFSAF